ncbi:MAG: EAL domain-containing protein [Pseudomonadota bacterium]
MASEAEQRPGGRLRRAPALARAWSLLFVVLCLMLCVPRAVQAQENGAPLPPFRVYATADGMSQAEVGVLAQDQSGYLWMGTLRGLNRFDGSRFTSFTIAEGLRQNHLTALLVDGRNRVWVGDAQGGVSMVKDDAVRLTISPPPGPVSPVAGLYEWRDQLLVATQGNGLWIVTVPGTGTDADPTKAPDWIKLEGLPENIDQLLGDRRQLALRSGTEVWSADVGTNPTFRRLQVQGTQLARSPTGAIWSAGVDGKPFNLSEATDSQSQLNTAFKRFLPTPEGELWQIVGDRLVAPDGQQRTLPTSDILTMFRDREGTLWLGSSKGLIRFLGFRFDHFPLGDSRDGRLVWSIERDLDGRFWFGTDNSLLTLSNGSVEIQNGRLQIPDGPVRDLLLDDTGGLWVAVRGIGLFRVAVDQMTASIVSGTESLEILDLALTDDGGLWFSTFSNGVLRLNPTSGELLRSDLPRNAGVYTITASGPAGVWAGVSGVGVFSLSYDKQRGITQSRLADRGQLNSPFIGQIAMTGNDSAWISTAGGGIYRYRDEVLENLGAGTPLASQNVYLIEPIDERSLLVGGDEGVYQFDLTTGAVYRHHALNGFIATEPNVHATYRASEDSLWIGTVSGVTRMDMSQPLPAVAVPKAEIVSFRTGSGRELKGTVDPLRPQDGGIIASFRAVSLLEPDQLEFSYRLSGFDADFQAGDESGIAQYLGLSDGAYEFQVRARIAGNPWGPVASHRVAILPPLWQRPAFVLSAVLVLLLVIYGVVWFWTRQIARINQRLREEVAERTRSIEQARLRLEQTNELLEYQANYDELTGLINRRSFEAKLLEAWSKPVSEGRFSYLMCMDLDQFKVVNDTCGHAAGDQLLCQVADLVSGQLRDGDIMGRLGGDEFGLIIHDCTREEALEEAEKVRAAVEELQFPWESEVFRIGVSIGGLPIDKDIGDVNELHQMADAACYSAKEAGRNQVHLVQGDKDLALQRRGEMRWVQRLHDAMEHNRFALYGQKIAPVDPNVKEPERMEVLLRMRDMETRKLIPPGAFLPSAERYGLSIKLDEWVVTNLLKSLFLHESFNAGGRHYWVNLSGASVGDPKFCQKLLNLMKDSPLPPGMVNFEITETAVIRSVNEAARLISALKEMGCAFALDDFGSGLSSFGYLKKLKVDYLKIDGMFVRDIVSDKTDRIFVKSIIDIAHTLNIKAIAEFVEDDEILEVIRSLGADYVQGYGIHRPELLAPSFPARQMSPGGPLADLMKAGVN